MKIYTYYENINHSNQNKMLDLWKISWQRAGFDPIILTIEDAKLHGFYNQFIEQIKELHIKIMDKQISPYGISCYVRWLAYCGAKPEEKFYVSDYDCVNNGLKPNKPIINHTFDKKGDELYLLDDACPCFAFGSKDNFEQLCKIFIELSLERLDEIKKLKNNSPCYHDQEFFQYSFVKSFNKEAEDLMKKYKILLVRNRDEGVGPFEINKKNTCQVIHISHHNAGMIKGNNKDLREKSINEIRLDLMETIISQN